MTAPLAESTRAMAARLGRLHESLREERGEPGPDGLFVFNKPWRIDSYRARIEALSGEGSKAIGQVLQLRLLLSLELLNDGRTQEALAGFEWLYRFTRETASRRSAADVRENLSLLHELIAVALLRSAEEANCLSRHGPDSCLFPLTGGGVHVEQGPARAALDVLLEELQADPNDHGARWLLNLAAMAIGEFPDAVPAAFRLPAHVLESDAVVAPLRNVAGSTGSDLRGLAGGAIIDDFDGDGWLDLVASSWGLSDPIRFLRNTGAGRFEDRSDAAGLTGETGGLNLSHADFDNDGDLDVLVLRGGWLGDHGAHPDSLLENLGGGRFVDATVRVGLDDAQPGQVGVWGDFDGDGWLDLFVGNEEQDEARPRPSRLYRNRGDGTFVDVAEALGIARLGWVKGAAWGDIDNDGRIDLYVSRLRRPNLLLHNRGPDGSGAKPWRFDDVTQASGVGEPISSFSSWFFDFDNDGWLDLFVAGYDSARIGDVAELAIFGRTTRETSRLFRNRGDGRFADISHDVGLDRVLLVMGANHGDVDGDGFEDIYLGTGAPDFRVLMPNRLLRNAEGRRLEDVTTSARVGHLQKGHGVAFGDLDNDGDLDLYTTMGGWYTGDAFPNALFENPGSGARFVTLRLVGVKANRFGVGARVRASVTTAQGSTRQVHALVGEGGSFGGSSLQVELGLGDARSLDELEIRWPGSGTRDTHGDVELDRVYRVLEGGRLEPVAVKVLRLGG